MCSFFCVVRHSTYKKRNASNDDNSYSSLLWNFIAPSEHLFHIKSRHLIWRGTPNSKWHLLHHCLNGLIDVKKKIKLEKKELNIINTVFCDFSFISYRYDDEVFNWITVTMSARFMIGKQERKKNELLPEEHKIYKLTNKIE